MSVIDPVEFKRRVRAAVALAGIPSEKALATKLDQRRLSYSNMRAMGRGESPIYHSDLFAIATACQLPVAWFYVDIVEAIRNAAATKQPEGARLPPLTGELDRRAGDDGPTAQDQPREGNPQEPGDQTGTEG